MNGFLFINKPQNIPSFDIIRILKQILGRQFKIGFSGTLDPIAEGLIIIGIGKATKLLDYFHLLPKSYIATAKLGFISNTYDSQGEITKVNDISISLQQLQKVFENFKGEQLQIPPKFSAKKINGKRAYKLARDGENFNIPPQKIYIYSLRLLDYLYPEFKFEITVSSGTYIRSIVDDIGKRLTTGAIMTSLVRNRIGNFSIDQAVDLYEIKSKVFLKNYLKSIDSIISSFIPELKIDNEFRLENGLPLKLEHIENKNDIEGDGIYYILKKNGKNRILAIVKAKKNDYNSLVFEYKRIISYDYF